MDIFQSLSNYIITPCGKVYSKFSNKLLSPEITCWGYQRVTLIDNSRKKNSYYIHRLVAMKYLSNPNNLKEVNHIDGNKLNNSIDNLEWISRSKNMKHAYDNDLINRGGENNPKNKLKELQVIEIYGRISKGENLSSLALEFNVTDACILSIKKKKRWKHLF